MESQSIFDLFYPKEEKKQLRPRQVASRWPESRYRTWFMKIRVPMVIAIIILIYIFIHMRYYNEFIDLEYNVDAAWAQVETQLQRRYHIQQNLSKLIKNYADHEKNVLVKLTEIRSLTFNQNKNVTSAIAGMTSNNVSDPSTLAQNSMSDPRDEPLKGQHLENMLSNLRLVAEQYPQLKLSQNLEQFSKAIIDTENEIAIKTSEYNTSVNIYSTAISKFPGNIFGWFCGFKNRNFYRPDKQTTRFLRVEF